MKNIKLPWYQLFKYTIYLLLSNNVYLFLRDDLISSSIMFSSGLSLKNVIVGFSNSIDTASWVILLIIFELETYIIEDHKLKGKLKWLLKFISSLCYAFIIYSFYGYITKYLWFFDFTTFTDNPSVCTHIGKSWLIEFDKYTTIALENCKNLSNNSQLFILSNENILTDIDILKSARRVALIDVFNSFAWLVIAIVIEIDVWLQLKQKLVGNVKKVTNIIKIIAYTILVISAISWGVSGIFLDTWDALLWVLAFVFIEMNLFKWQKNIENNTIESLTKNNDN